jgi:hypothetical protein
LMRSALDTPQSAVDRHNANGDNHRIDARRRGPLIDG